MVGETGLEPAALRSQTVRSSHLSYSPIVPPVGIEPTLCRQNEILSLARLPISPQRQEIFKFLDDENYTPDWN